MHIFCLNNIVKPASFALDYTNKYRAKNCTFLATLAYMYAPIFYYYTRFICLKDRVSISTAVYPSSSNIVEYVIYNN